MCKTEAEQKDAWAPGDLGYATRIPGEMLIVTIVLCYSVIAPLILLFGVLYFGLGWLVLRNQALKVLVPKYETYGRMWPHIFIRIIASLILYQVTMFGYFGTKRLYYAPPMMIPLIIISFIFCCVCNNKLCRFYQSTALEVAAHEMKETLDMEVDYRSFIPPSLSSEKGAEHQFEDALSSLLRTGALV